MSTQNDFPPDANHAFVWHGEEAIAKAMRGEAGNEEWTKRSIWNYPVYKRLFAYLDRAGGFFYERWSDSPIHSFGLAMTLRKDQVAECTDIGYQHQNWEYSCPAQSSSCTYLQEKKYEDFDDGHGATVVIGE
ncbi:hypothetical protein H0H92_002030 [Tricholoma furcatifolium]|nr:hypothetical protein H0H92_002030 [Tricholoma furcatifolium]